MTWNSLGSLKYIIDNHTDFVYTRTMKNITLSADEKLIEEARKQAAQQHTTLNNLFRDWLIQVTARKQAVSEYEALTKRLSYVRPGRKFTREEMNTR